MITERKLRSLKPDTRLRKIARLLASAEELAHHSAPIDVAYASMLISLAREELSLPKDDFDPADPHRLLREMNRIRHTIRSKLGEDPAEWDLLPRYEAMRRASPGDALDPRAHANGITRAFLEDIRSPFNVGAIFRTAAAYGVTEIVLSSECASPTHPRAIRSAMGAVDMVVWRVAGIDELDRTGLFALETGGIGIERFDFPRSGTVIVGNEELGIAPETRRMAVEKRGICSIELPGTKTTLNVAVAFGILMQRWHEANKSE